MGDTTREATLRWSLDNEIILLYYPKETIPIEIYTRLDMDKTDTDALHNELYILNEKHDPCSIYMVLDGNVNRRTLSTSSSVLPATQISEVMRLIYALKNTHQTKEYRPREKGIWVGNVTDQREVRNA